MDRQEIFNKIVEKKDFSKLPKKDIEKAFEYFEKRECSDYEKIKLTRDLLRKVFSAFASKKIFSLKDKPPEWILRKHISTRERIPYYTQIYKRIFRDIREKDIVIFDLGAGINGFSYGYFPKKIKYVGIESIGQLVDLMNYFFKNKNFEAKAIQESLFELDKIENYIKEEKGYKIIFLFKVIDSLEMLEKNYSKKLIERLSQICDRFVISYSTRSLIKKEKFKARRIWIKKFIEERYKILDEFEFSGEKYIVFKSK